MFGKLEIFQIAGGLARHAGARQNVIARNIANTDTPGYTSKDIAPFADTVDASGSPGLRASRPGHLNLEQASGTWTPKETGPASNKPNSVSLESEMVKAAEVQQQHTMAVNIYRSAMDILTTSIRSR